MSDLQMQKWMKLFESADPVAEASDPAISDDDILANHRQVFISVQNIMAGKPYSIAESVKFLEEQFHAAMDANDEARADAIGNDMFKLATALTQIMNTFLDKRDKYK